jgi:hypothetical protein
MASLNLAVTGGGNKFIPPPSVIKKAKSARPAKASRDKEWSRLTVGGTNKQGNVDRIRNLDGYHTPPVAVDMLCDAIPLGHRIWEPANGFNRISDRLEDKGFAVHRSDIFAWTKKTKDIQDFTKIEGLKVPFRGKPFNIVTNPPFIRAAEFVETAMSVLPSGGNLCLLLRLQFLEGAKRKKLFTRYPPTEVLVFSKRLPRMHRFDFDLNAFLAGHSKEPSSALAFAWFVWRKCAKDKEQRAIVPTIRWL